MIFVNGGDLFQWNLGRSVTYTPESGEVINELHFANPGDVKALIMDAVAADGTYTAEIPNILLQAGKSVCVWAVHKTEVGRHTIEMFVAPVRKQVRPADYVYTQTEIKSYADLENEIARLDEAISKIGTGGGLNITDDGIGNVAIVATGSVSITDDGAGNVTIA